MSRAEARRVFADHPEPRLVAWNPFRDAELPMVDYLQLPRTPDVLVPFDEALPVLGDRAIPLVDGGILLEAIDQRAWPSLRQALIGIAVPRASVRPEAPDDDIPRPAAEEAIAPTPPAPRGSWWWVAAALLGIGAALSLLAAR